MKFSKISMFLPALVLCCCAFFLSACGDNRLEREAPSMSMANIIVVDRTVTIDGFSNAMYSKDRGLNWQEENVFADLVYDKTYSFCVKIKADDTYKESPISNIVEKKISKPRASKPVLKSNNFVVEGNKLIIQGFTNAMYSNDNGATWQDGNIFANLTNAQTYAIRVKYKETETNAQSEPSDAYMFTMPKNQQDAPLLGENSVIFSQANKTIRINGFSNLVEYSIDGGQTAQDSNIFVNLVAGSTYKVCVRYKESNTSYKSEWSNIITITFDKDTQVKPMLSSSNIVQNGFDLQVTGFEDKTARYSIDGGTTWQESNIFEDLTIGTEYLVTIQLLETSSLYGTEKADNFAYTMQKIARQTPVLTQANVTQNEFSLTISGFENEDAVYSIDNGANWQAENTFNDLSVTGIYTIVVKLNETSTHLASEISNSLTFAMQKLVRSEVPTLTESDITQEGFTLVITRNDLYEYSINGGESWQANNVFTITIGTTYSVTVRYAENDTYKASASAEIIEFTTQKLTRTAPTIDLGNISQNGFNLEIIGFENENVWYSINNGIGWQESNIFENLTIGETYNITVKYVATNDYNESEPATAIEYTMQKLTQNAPSLEMNVQTIDDAQYIVVTPVEGSLYKFDDGEWSTENRMKATCADGEISVSIKLAENSQYLESEVTTNTISVPHGDSKWRFHEKCIVVEQQYIVDVICEKCEIIRSSQTTTRAINTAGLYMFTNYSNPSLVTDDFACESDGSSLITFILVVDKETGNGISNGTIHQTVNISYVCDKGTFTVEQMVDEYPYDFALSKIAGLKEINISYQLNNDEPITRKITFTNVTTDNSALEAFVGVYKNIDDDSKGFEIKNDNGTYKVLFANATVSEENPVEDWREISVACFKYSISKDNEVTSSSLTLVGAEFQLNVEKGTLLAIKSYGSIARGKTYAKITTTESK